MPGTGVGGVGLVHVRLGMCVGPDRPVPPPPLQENKRGELDDKKQKKHWRPHRRVFTVWSDADITGDTAAIITTRAFSEVKESFRTRVSLDARKGIWLFLVSMALLEDGGCVTSGVVGVHDAPA